MPFISLLASSSSSAKNCTIGTHRTRTPGETLSRYRPLMPSLGITRLANITGLDVVGIPVVAAIRPNSATSATSLGKGLDLAAAMTSALMESIETWHAENLDVPLRLGSYADLRGRYPMIAASDLTWRATRPSEHAQELWVEGEELVARAPVWVPFHSASLVPGPRRNLGGVVQDTNGLASGNHPIEAIVHGLCEVIERDALVLWRVRAGGFHRIERGRRLDLSTVTDPGCQSVLDALRAASIHVGVWDVTSDLGVPVFACLILERPDQLQMRTMTVDLGSGCHLSPAIALLRALTEAVQSRATYIAGARDNLTREGYARARSRDLQLATWEAISGGEGDRSFLDVPDLTAATFEEDLRTLIERLSAAGMSRVVAVDLARPEVGVPVVKVIVPGLESIHAPPRARAERFREVTHV